MFPFKGGDESFPRTWLGVRPEESRGVAQTGEGTGEAHSISSLRVTHGYSIGPAVAQPR